MYIILIFNDAYDNVDNITRDGYRCSVSEALAGDVSVMTWRRFASVAFGDALAATHISWHVLPV